MTIVEVILLRLIILACEYVRTEEFWLEDNGKMLYLCYIYVLLNQK